MPPSPQFGDRKEGIIDVESKFPSQSHAEDGHSLLTALRGVIIPLVQTVAPYSQVRDEALSTLEAENLLVALQRYISSLIKGQHDDDGRSMLSETVTLKRLELRGITDLEGRREVSRLATSNKSVVQIVQETSTEISSHSTISIGPQLTVNSLVGIGPNLLREGLRSKVFNNMPIRLLRFQQHAYKLEIELLDRAQIYSLLVRGCSETFEDARHILLHVSQITQYAILSHTWLRSAIGEVTYADWQKGTFDVAHPGYQKIANFCRVSLEKHSVMFGWMDTVCIDKSSSSELDESIRSMYKWYQNAKICVTYLAETTAVSDMVQDPWFTRGWTLQELLAPLDLKFYGCDWKQLINSLSTDKMNPNVMEQIEAATSINGDELRSHSSASISRKMQWAAMRQVTRKEDGAYSLMGIFGINMSIAYGEGAESAFFRLLKEIFSTAKSEVIDIFNWGEIALIDKPRPSVLLPDCAKCYLRRKDIMHVPETLMEPLMLTHLGLRVPVLIFPANGANNQPTEYTSMGNYYANVHLDLHSRNEPGTPDSYTILDLKEFHPAWCNRYAFTILNCSEGSMVIYIPKTCFAVAFKYFGEATLAPLTEKCKITTKSPITFPLHSKDGCPEIPADHYLVTRKDLKRHGMQFLYMYF